MRVMHKDLRETHQVGGDTPEKIIDPIISPLMLTLQIGLAGVSDAGEGFEMVRLDPHFGHVLACFSGEGNVLVNGRWRRCTAGTAYLTPPHQPHAYQSIPGARWGFAWIWWTARRNERPMIHCDRPTLVRADPEYLRSAILGLYRESIGPAHGPEIDHWVELVRAYAQRIGEQTGEPRERRRSLVALWERIDADLARPWTRQMLADAAGMSGEHLRRLCQRETGRGPMHHVTILRMRRAGMLLESTDQKIAAIARSVGYENAFAFSTAFKRQAGVSPAEYRLRRRAEKRPRAAVRVRVGRGGASQD